MAVAAAANPAKTPSNSRSTRRRLLWGASKEGPLRHGLERGRTRRETRELQGPEEPPGPDAEPDAEQALLAEIIVDYVSNSLVRERYDEEQVNIEYRREMHELPYGTELQEEAFGAEAGDDGSSQPLHDPQQSIPSPFGQKPSHDLGDCTWYDGCAIEVDLENGTTKLSQTAYIESMLNRFNVTTTAPTPAVVDDDLGPKRDDESSVDKPVREAIGCLMWLLFTRPDIALPLNKLQKIAHSPTERMWNALVRIMSYLNETKDLGITYVRGSGLDLDVFVDSSYADSTVDRRSTTGLAVTVGGTVVCASTKTQPVTAQSTTEAEYIAAGEGVKEALFVRGVLSFIAPETSGATIRVREDNEGALALVQNPFSSARSKHIDVRFHFIRELFKAGKITADYVSTEEQHADMLTKATGMWTGTTARGAGGPWTKEIASVMSSATEARGGERPRPLQPHKGCSGGQQQKQQDEGDVKVLSVGASGEEGARCWEDAVAATPAKGTPDQCPEMPLESDDEGPPAAGVAVMLGEPITDSKVLMAVRMPEATASAEADVSYGGVAPAEREASGGLEKASGEVPVIEATVAKGGLVVEVDASRLQAMEEVADDSAGGSTATVPGAGAVSARLPVSSSEAADRADSPVVAAKKAEEGGLVPGLASRMAVVETVVAAPGTLTIKTRKVSSEERQMAGAPQGEIFDVVALKSSEVPASVDAVQATVVVKDWASLFAAVSSARVLLLHHRDVFGREYEGPGLIGQLVSLVADAVSNRRSVVQTNGLRCLGEMFRCVLDVVMLACDVELKSLGCVPGSSRLGSRAQATAICVVGNGMTADQMGTLVRSTLSCHKSSSTFCGEEAKKAMEAALANADPVPLLSAVLPQALDRHPKVARLGVIYTAECLSRLHEGSVVGGGLADDVDVMSVVAALAKGASSRDSDGKDAAWSGVEMCRKALGHDVFEATIAEHLDQKGVRAIRDLVSDKARRKTRTAREAAAAVGAGKATAGRPSIRFRRRVADGGAFGKPAASGGLGGRDGLPTPGDGRCGHRALGEEGAEGDRIPACVSSWCDGEAGSGAAGGYGIGGASSSKRKRGGPGEPVIEDIAPTSVSTAEGKAGMGKDVAMEGLSIGGEAPRNCGSRKGSCDDWPERCGFV
ncbi:unnamed protein product [Ectocarpus sp. CCAP 1310/34]|nr:unnamed protein product [Ectocarpus sp. CCAP 1310/34]